MFIFKKGSLKNRNLIYSRQYLKLFARRSFTYNLTDETVNKFVIDIYSVKGSVMIKVIKNSNNQVVVDDHLRTGRIDIPVYSSGSYTFKIKYKHQSGYVRIFLNKE